MKILLAKRLVVIAVILIAQSFACVRVNMKGEIMRDYYNRAQKIELPFHWKNTGNEFPIDVNKFLKINEIDTQIFGNEALISTMMGVLPDTSKFFTFLFYYPGDDLIPYLMTFDKKGEKIDELKTGYGCGADCGFYCMEGNFTLDKSLEFKSHHISYQAECDANYENMDTTFVTYYVRERKGEIKKNGKITEGKDITKEKRKMPFSSPENPLRNNEDY